MMYPLLLLQSTTKLMTMMTITTSRALGIWAVRGQGENGKVRDSGQARAGQKEGAEVTRTDRRERSRIECPEGREKYEQEKEIWTEGVRTEMSTNFFWGTVTKREERDRDR
jgi:hypothetical protein